ncbi:hypothetical protein VTN77DRAFT_1761 [Rasamsonia byssochlamydoides]|uniref:uncharacterized protein n=1 Tax=Rasamsonia byssochlamydoides TaxID=89139 RepID=UPI0037423499
MFLPLLLVPLFFLPAVVLGILPPSSGHNNSNPKVLFLTNSERGQANIHLATAHALVANHHDSVQVHFATFPVLEDAVEQVSRQAIRSIPDEDAGVQGIVFHPIGGSSYKDAMIRVGITMDGIRHPPGVRGAATFSWIMEKMLVPWTGPEYVEVYNNMRQIITDVDPDIIVVDSFFPPGNEAAKSLKRSRIFLSPNSPKDTIALRQQGMGKIWWHYPALASAYPYPVPWHLIPANIYLISRIIWEVLVGGRIRQLEAYLKAHGVGSATEFFQFNDLHIPWLVSFSPEMEYPISLPASVVSCGPIYMALDTVENEDAELATWLARAPTVLIVLGSHTAYDERAAGEMIRTIRMVLDGDDRVQVLWKLKMLEDSMNSANRSKNINTSLSDELASLLSTGRVRIQPWLSADPASMLESGHVICYVHHGGANSFGESIGTGVPQVVLPMWADTYDYAVRAEWLGVGIWGNRHAAPFWTAEETSQAVLKIISGGDSGNGSYHRKAKALATPSREQAGRNVAAREIVRLVRQQQKQHAPVEEEGRSNNQIPIWFNTSSSAKSGSGSGSESGSVSAVSDEL